MSECVFVCVCVCVCVCVRMRVCVTRRLMYNKCIMREWTCVINNQKNIPFNGHSNSLSVSL